MPNTRRYQSGPWWNQVAISRIFLIDGKSGNDNDGNNTHDEGPVVMELGRVQAIKTAELGGSIEDACLPTISSDDDGPNSSGFVVTLEEKDGRPSLPSLLKPFQGAACPGLFLCGPTNLMLELRSTAKTHCAFPYQNCVSNTPSIAIYEEAFHL